METTPTKKKQNRTRVGAVTFRVTPEERQAIEKRMADAGIRNLRAYMLKQAVDGHIIHIELDSVREMCCLLSNATNNINQIARRVNSGGSVYAKDINELKGQYTSLNEQAKVILLKLAAMV